jgi:hypothetical protein
MEINKSIAALGRESRGMASICERIESQYYKVIRARRYYPMVNRSK